MKLIAADCMLAMRELDAQSVGLVLCDLPYGTTLNTWDTVLPLGELWRQYKRLLTPTGCVVLFGSQPFTSTLVMSNTAWFKHELIWDKNKCGSPGLAKIRPMKTHENILVFAPGRTVYNPQMEVGEPYSRKTSKPEGYVGRCNNHKYGMKPRTEFNNEGTRYPKSVRRVSRDFSAQQQVHSAQKPVPLMEWLVRTYSNEGDVVLDNCMGSGSTGVAALSCGREFVGIEIDHRLFMVANERLTKIKS